MTSLVSPTPATPGPHRPDGHPLLSIDSALDGPLATLSATGEIDLATVGHLRTAFDDCLEQGAVDLTIDLDGVSYIDSAGLGFVVSAHKRVLANAGSLVVRCSQPRVLQLFEITRLTGLLTIVGTEDDLLESAV
jgi:anti-sigma B factor antagonist